PTRELAAQVAESFEKYVAGHKLTVALVIGGVSFDDQDTKVTSGVDVRIATPGLLLVHFQRGCFLRSGIVLLMVVGPDRVRGMVSPRSHCMATWINPRAQPPSTSSARTR